MPLGWHSPDMDELGWLGRWKAYNCCPCIATVVCEISRRDDFFPSILVVVYPLP